MKVKERKSAGRRRRELDYLTERATYSDTLFRGRMVSRNTTLASISNLSTAYNLIIINLAHVIIQNQYCGGDKCHDKVVIASTSCLVGAICGQLTFGYVGDCLGRSRALQLTMALSILGALLSACAVPTSADDPSTIFYFIAVVRFFLGLTVGGVYPLSATIASESSAKASQRGRTASIVFSMQGVGTVLVPLVGLILVQLPGGNPADCSSSATDCGSGASWRLALGLGALPGILMAPFKVRSSAATPRPQASDEASRRPSALRPSTTSTQSLWQVLQVRAVWGKLLGTAGGWFLFDITFYGNQLFQAPVLAVIFNTSHSDGPEPLAGGLQDNPALQMLFVALIGLPGYYVAVCFMDRLGRKAIQLQGFIAMASLFLLIGLFLAPLKRQPGLMLFLYGLTFFFSNFGPNSTTFILPAETFPRHLRSTLNGFCAACGKLGATIGSAVFLPLKRTPGVGLGGTMIACGVVSLVGAFLTWAFVEDRRGKGMEGEEGGEETEMPIVTLDSAALAHSSVHSEEEPGAPAPAFIGGGVGLEAELRDEAAHREQEPEGVAEVLEAQSAR